MTADDLSQVTTVDDCGSVSIPEVIRRDLGIDAGDKLRWNVDVDDFLTVEVIHQREGVFDDFEPVDVGETNAVDAESEFGSE